ncbi:unnamed protein product [Nyctereutes procyonoides]|uniref:(raccoon dog) hypothetical protein n=1 Tax=Nyctereutes procyonoides TaxID=34880 RepID=A0A811YHQ9_NYCPR|nr:unnamed protein product [Nyctereutes procyonoides]
MTSKNPPVLNTRRAPSSAGCCVCLQPALETSKAAVLQPLSKEEATARRDSAEAAGLITGGAEVGTRDSRALALPRPHRASRACRAAERRLPGAGAGAHGDSGPDPGAPRPARWGRGGRADTPAGAGAEGRCSSPPQTAEPDSRSRPAADGTGPPRHLSSRALQSQPELGSGTGAGRGAPHPPTGPGPLLGPAARPAPPRGPGPRPREDGTPRPPPPHPSAPPRAFPPTPPQLPRSRPGSARVRPRPGSHLEAAGPPLGPPATRVRPPPPREPTPGSHSSSNPAPAFPAPPAPPAEPRLRDTAQAHT